MHNNCRRKVYDPPLRVIYPKEADDGLWGGEGIVKGFMHNQKTDDLCVIF